MQLLSGWTDFRRPVNIVAIGLGAIGLIGVVMSYLQLQISQITFQIVQIAVLNARQAWSGTEGPGGGSLTFPFPFTVLDRNGREITKNVYAAEITVWNSGDIELGEGKVRIPLTIRIQGDPQILDRSISRVTNDEAQITLNKETNHSDTIILWKYFDPEMGFRLRIIYVSDTQQDITIQSNILGVHSLRDLNDPKKSWTTQAKAIGEVMLTFVITGTFAIRFAKMLDKMLAGRRVSRATGNIMVIFLMAFLIGGSALGTFWAYGLLRPPTPPF